MPTFREYWWPIFVAAWDKTPLLRPDFTIGSVVVSIIAAALSFLLGGTSAAIAADVVIYGTLAWLMAAAVWWFVHAVREPWKVHRRQAEAARQERDEYRNETVFLPSLLTPGSRTLTGKQFHNCLLLGPVFFKALHQVTLEFCVVPDDPNMHFLSAPEGEPIAGAVVLIRCVFDKCCFDERVAFIVVPSEKPVLLPGVEKMSVPMEAWKQAHLQVATAARM